MICPFIFKSPECNYAGSVESCNKTFDNCRKLENIERFGVFPEYKVTVKGNPLTKETIIIAALVKRLGGNVFLLEEELSLIPGLVITDKDEGIILNA